MKEYDWEALGAELDRRIARQQAVAKQPATRDRALKYEVYHQPSGTVIRQFSSKNEAKAFVKQLKSRRFPTAWRLIDRLDKLNKMPHFLEQFK